MYERMLDKQTMPSIEEFIETCGKRKQYFIQIDQFLIDELKLKKNLRFPYGNQYGWGMKYASKTKHICDIFAEKDAFTVMLRMDNKQFDQVFHSVSKDTQELIQNKYPCSDGGWIHFRILNLSDLTDLKLLLTMKATNLIGGNFQHE